MPGRAVHAQCTALWREPPLAVESRRAPKPPACLGLRFDAAATAKGHDAEPDDPHASTCWDHVVGVLDAYQPRVGEHLVKQLAARDRPTLVAVQQALVRQPYDQRPSNFACLRVCEDEEKDELPADWLEIETRDLHSPLWGTLDAGPRRQSGLLGAVVAGSSLSARDRIVRNMAVVHSQGWRPSQ